MAQPHYDDLDFEKKIFILASGGKDSTAMSLELWDYCHFHGIDADISLLYGDTRINRAGGKSVLDRLHDLTGWPLLTARYEGEKPAIQILHESFRLIPKAIERAQGFTNGGSKSYKTLFPCCSILKKHPMDHFINSLKDKEVILLLGIKGGDIALHRRYRMAQLERAGTYYRRHKKNGLLYYYPLRDCQQTDIEHSLGRFGFGDIQSSGCSMCPIFCVADWKKKDVETWRRSVAMAQRLKVPLRAENQLGIEAFCGSEVAD